MLCNSEKMGMLPTDEWTQRMMIGERFLMHNNTTTTSNSTSPGTNNIFNRTAPSSSSSSSSTAAARAMVQQQEQHTAAASPPLKCPRCDSSNTKFCYYNNYNLSQPRHFCKACKRYWTRGGTLRNVPVGGGCRKNKRVKKAPTASTSAATAPHTDPPPPPLIPPLSLPTASHIDASVSRSDLNSFIYGLPSTSSDMNLAAFPGLQSIACTAYDLQPQLNALGLGFPTTQRDDEQYQSGFVTNLTDLQQSATFLNGYSNLESHLSSATGASLLVSNIKQPKRVEDYQALLPYEDLQASENGNFGLTLKEVKVEGGQSNVMGSHSMDWQVPCEIYPFDAINAAASVSDSSYLYWNPAVGGAAWPDAANSSVAPLI